MIIYVLKGQEHLLKLVVSTWSNDLSYQMPWVHRENKYAQGYYNNYSTCTMMMYCIIDFTVYIHKSIECFCLNPN